MAAREFCADVSRESSEPLAATASRVDHWILVEYRGLWGHDAVDASGLPEAVKAHLRERAHALSPAKVVFVRRPERRSRLRLRVFWALSAERGPALYGTEIEDYEDLLGLEFVGGVALDQRLLLVCTHGKHDRCCARLGRPLYEALREQADPDWVWQCTHVGGDRFAGNLLCLPEGLYFGRVGAGEAWSLLDDYLAGRVQLDLYRGRSCYPFPVQAAERRVREDFGLVGLDEIGLVSCERDAGAWSVRFRAGARTFDVEVVEEAGELTYLTCSAKRLSRPRRFVARSLRVAGV